MGDLVSIYNKENIRKNWIVSSDPPQKKKSSRFRPTDVPSGNLT